MPLVMDHPSLDRERGHSFGASCHVQPWQEVTARFASLDADVSDDALPHFSLLIPHTQISTGVLQVFSCCNTMGEFHPQRICWGKGFINRKRTDLQPTRWSGKAYVLDLQ